MLKILVPPRTPKSRDAGNGEWSEKTQLSDKSSTYACPVLYHFLTVLCEVFAHAVLAQKFLKIQTNSRAVCVRGKWTLLFDKDWKIGDAGQAAYYRLIEYQAGKPTWTARDYFFDGRLQWEGQLLSENPDVNTGVCTWYNEDGTKQRESTL